HRDPRHLPRRARARRRRHPHRRCRRILRPRGGLMPKLSEHVPLIHPTAEVETSTLGRYLELEARSRVSETELGDYSYVMQDCAIWCATIGKFVNIAAAVRINATNHPVWRATLHHFTYRAADYFDDAADEEAFFGWRRENAVTIGNDVWI